MYLFPLPPNQVIQFHGEITDHAGLRAVVTLNKLAVPTVFQISVSNIVNPENAEQWKFRTRGVGENDDDATLILPNDYNIVTNDNIWVRIG